MLLYEYTLIMRINTLKFAHFSGIFIGYAKKILEKIKIGEEGQ
jgi:hypothetical protein